MAGSSVAANGTRGARAWSLRAHLGGLTPARMRSTTSYPEPGVVLELALVADGAEGITLESVWVPPCRLGQSRRRGRASPSPQPPTGIHPSALRDGGQEVSLGAPADERAHSRLLHRLGPGPGRLEVHELAVELRLIARPDGLRGARCSRTMSWRPPKTTPWSSASARFQPKPTPRVTRPPERWSRVATCLAKTTGSCWATRRIPVPARSRGDRGRGGQRDRGGRRRRL